MLPTFTSVLQLVEFFDTEKKCHQYLQVKRWGKEICCPYCEKKKIYRFKDEVRLKCASCKRIFNAKVGTFFEDSNIPLKKWFLAIYLLSGHKKGISSYQLAKDIGVTQKTAWFVDHRIREAMNQEIEPMKNVVEVDETHIGGKVPNMTQDNRKKHRKSEGKSHMTAVMGFIERDGNVKAVVIPDKSRDTMWKELYKTIEKGSKVMTDSYPVYKGLNINFIHSTVNHEKGEFGRGSVHTNTIEGFFSLLKRGLYGIYHYVSPEHLQRYCNEVAFRYNTRKIGEQERIDVILNNCQKRLTYEQLTKKANQNSI